MFLLFSSSVLANDTILVPKFKRWNIGVSISPDYNFRKIIPIKNQSSKWIEEDNKSYADSLDLVEFSSIKYTFGLSVFYRFNKYFSLKTGIFCSDKGLKSKGFVYGNGIVAGYNIFQSNEYKKSRFLFMEIPLTLQVLLMPSKFKKINFGFNLGGTICTNFNKHEYESRRWMIVYNQNNLESSYRKDQVEKFTLLYFGYTAGLPFYFKFNKSFIFGIEPIFKYYSKQYLPVGTYQTKIHEQPYSYGCNFSVNYQF